MTFEPSTPGHAIPEMNIVLHHSAEYVILSDIHRKVLYFVSNLLLTFNVTYKISTAKMESISSRLVERDQSSFFR